MLHSLSYAYRDRKNKRRELRSLWIVRINAACRNEGMTYSGFIKGLKKAKIDLDRKILSEMAISDPAGFGKLIEIAKG